MRLYVFLCPVYGVWTVSTADKASYLSGFGLVLATYPTHAEAFADAWARTHPEEVPDALRPDPDEMEDEAMKTPEGTVHTYVCEVCSGEFALVQVDAGEVPRLLFCRAKEGCYGPALPARSESPEGGSDAPWEWVLRPAGVPSVRARGTTDPEPEPSWQPPAQEEWNLLQARLRDAEERVARYRSAMLGQADQVSVLQEELEDSRGR